ncbi:hypothetical protein EFN63_04860 [Leuconostoc citreum]|uniref:hypothetical protein n=2 Tax=Leuconostoc citreum TaxID=33964 RepID=UPI000A1D876B|nr:hypothetical protein [Leuconostoc citreum]MCP1275846.1 hypothetical protein [Leuconostoc citreum]MCT3067703.1 hypothetical protein [Leuconostoc citreum]OSP81989.1 hypothetical protein B9J75_04880 [Leuconostoc citreum]QEA45432.1 hypothetical protein FGL82_03040 [Leuconostoc citreum]QEA63814.1 hypothetical protein FGL72_08440 [Leuconostoc citreum]
MLMNMLGMLVQRFGISEPVAFSIVHIMSTGGAYAVAIAYPAFAPFIATAKAYLAIMGMAAGVGF